MKFAIRNWLILIGLVFGGVKRGFGENVALKKAGASSRTPNEVIYNIKYSKNLGEVKGDFWAANEQAAGLAEDRLRRHFTVRVS